MKQDFFWEKLYNHNCKLHLHFMINEFGLAVQTLGEILIAAAVLVVHHRLKNDHKVDRPVMQAIQIEQCLGVFGVVFIFVGFIFQLL